MQSMVGPAANVDAASAILKSNAFLIQTHGYSRGSCRRLEQIANQGMKIYDAATAEDDAATADERAELRQSVRDLWIVCVDIMRAVAREVGEDGKAYFRHRQIRLLTANAASTWETAKNDDRIIVEKDSADYAEAMRVRAKYGALYITPKTLKEKEICFACFALSRGRPKKTLCTLSALAMVRGSE